MRLMVGETRDLLYATRATLEGQLAQLTTQTRAQGAEIAHLRAELGAHVAQLEAASAAAAGERQAHQAQLVELIRLMHDRLLQRRERLQALRGDVSYARAFDEPEPLVSIVIPTFDNYELLRDRAIPSVLAQTYQNFEIVVVGDAAPDAARRAAESFGDPRIRFVNLDYRGPHPAVPEKLWLISGTQPFNEGVRQASGLWIAPLDDDDAFRPDHLARLLAHARTHRVELAYGRICIHSPGGATATVGRFPPDLGHFNLQAAVYHAGLADIFGLEVIDAPLGNPNDWGWCTRLMEAGVRIGMTPEVVTDYYPSREWTPRWEVEEHRNGDAPEWEFVPEGWDRARSEEAAAPGGWQAEEVARSYAAKWPLFLEAVAGTGPLGVGHEVPTGAAITRESTSDQSAVLAYAYALSRAAAGSTRLSVLDWGGALGHFYVLARRLFPDLEFDYHCRELPAVCDEGRRLLPEVTFHDSDECLNRRYDLVLASNSLQYDEDWPERLRRLASVAERRLFLTRVPVVREAESFVTLQRAQAYGYGTEYLGWVFNREELIEAAVGAGLALEREFVLVSGWPVAGTPEGPSEYGYLFAPVQGNGHISEVRSIESRL